MHSVPETKPQAGTPQALQVESRCGTNQNTYGLSRFGDGTGAFLTLFPTVFGIGMATDKHDYIQSIGISLALASGTAMSSFITSLFYNSKHINRCRSYAPKKLKAPHPTQR